MNAAGGRASCAILGPGAATLARAALRRQGRRDSPSLLIQVGGARLRARRPALPSAALRQVAAELRGVAGGEWEVVIDGSLVRVVVPPASVGDPLLAQAVERHAGAVALGVELPRDDDVDRLLRIVDEIVAVEPATPAVREVALRELARLGPVVTADPPRGAGARGVAPPPVGWKTLETDAGQSTVAVVAMIAVVIAVASGLALVASALGRDAGAQGRADVAALAGARALLDAQPEYFSADPARRITSREYRSRALRAARTNADANDLQVKEIELLGDAELPTQVRVTVRSEGADASSPGKLLRSTAEVAIGGATELAAGGGYSGPLAVRQGQRMRPDVALAFDRMEAAARDDGHALVIASAFRSDAEQARLFAANPDPRWVAPPGKSLHRLGTELDVGPNSAYGWLAANAKRFGFLQRYSWEPWHYGYVRSPGTTSVGYRASGGSSDEDGEQTKSGGSGEASGSAIPTFVPARYAPLISKAAQRWSVGAALLGAQLSVESNFNPNAVSPAGAAGLAQFMPGTAAAYGLTPAERFDPAKAIDAQAHHMHDLLRQFASVPLALAAYNAGAGNVSKCMCVPPFPETQAYVQKILGLLGGAGIAAPAGLEIRLVA